VPAKDRGIAMEFQSYALYPHMSVRDNLAFGLRRRAFAATEIERRVAAAALTLGLEPYLERKPHALSGGQRQRVALGRAIVRDPKVFLFDEPLSNLDAALRVSTRAELSALHQRLHATMVYVTHDQVEAMTMGTRICIMNGGRVEQLGAPLEVYRRPANTFVAGFLGSPPMNLVPVRAQAQATQPGLQVGEQWLPAAGLLGDLQHAPDAGTALTLGIRPEDLRLHPEGELRAEVVACEALGSETLVQLRLPGCEQPLKVRADRDQRPSPGEWLALRPDLQRASLFDARSGKALV
jgi:multiple sugar transport system ATP-binding protein